jgi:hypothetical protein
MNRCFRPIWRFITIPLRPSFSAEEDVEMGKARDWFFNFQPVREKDYSLALTYARQKYDDVKEAYAALDKKAEWIFGIGILATSAAFLVFKERHIGIFWGLSFLAFSAWGILGALRARVPADKATPMSIRDVIERVANTYDATPWICASLHHTTMWMKKSAEWKALLLKNACYSIFIAMILLGLTAIFSKPFSSPTDHGPPGSVRSALQQGAGPAGGAAGEAEGWKILLKVENAR